MIADKEQIKWCKEKWGTNEEPEETPIERPHYDNDSLKNLDKNFNENCTHEKEQIMIDGCNVSGCEYACNTAFGKNGCKHPVMKNIYCFKNPNCDFKQLARKTQECDFWKHQAELGSETTDRLAKQLEEKEQLCEALKSEGFTRESLITEQENEIDELRQECEELKKEIEALEKINRRNDQELLRRLTYASNAERQRDRYRKALDEVEEIAKSFNINGLCFYNEINECDDCDMGADCNYFRRAKILYIINKAKGEE